MWTLIVNYWPDFDPQSVSVDYEAAAINSIRDIFPMCEIRGCLYHLTHNMKNKFADAGLTQVIFNLLLLILFLNLALSG